MAALTPIVFSVHPRTAKQLQVFGMEERVRGIRGLTLIEPLGPVDFISLLEGAAFAITDSGGVPEECTYLGIPCLTLRDRTERPATVKHGINHLVDDDPQVLLREAKKILAKPVKRKAPPKGWDGKAALRINRAILQLLKKKRAGR